jgi:hypothetical protein
MLGDSTSSGVLTNTSNRGSSDLTSSLTTSWQKFTLTSTSTIDSAAIAVSFSTKHQNASNNANDYVEITQVKIEEGQSATTFNRAGHTMAGEFIACQRFYEKSYPLSSFPGTTSDAGHYATGKATNTTTIINSTYYKVTKRTTPTVTIYAYNGTSGSVSDWDGTTSIGSSAAPKKSSENGFNGISISSSLTSSNDYWWHWAADCEV